MANKQTSGNPREGKAGPGRPKGSRNKVTQEAKAVIAEAAERLGGVDRLVTWAKKDPANEKAFWSQVYPKLLPLTVAGDPDNPIRHVARIELVSLVDDNS